PTDGALGFYCRFHGPNATNQGMQGAFFSKKGQTVATGGSAGATASSAATASTTAASSSSGRSGY
ncbi:MAG TPA: hypothetical protein VKH36_10655, partial [Acidimicrobiia bacterium]|nr:hypothetical protein [Acidimicrobiia bacterium]